MRDDVRPLWGGLDCGSERVGTGFQPNLWLKTAGGQGYGILAEKLLRGCDFPKARGCSFRQ